MFIGHFAPAFAAAAVSPRAPKLGTLFIAAQLVDWAFFGLAIVGVEAMRIDPSATAMVPYDLYHMPYTHSLLGTGVWAVIFGLLVFAILREASAGILAALVVASHWLLDFVTHRPDLTLAGGDSVYGLGLWNLPFIAIPLELSITLGAFYWYVKRTRGPVGPPIILLVLLLIMQAVNWFGPHPDEAGLGLYVQALIAFGVLTLAARWVGDNRKHKRAMGWR
ncbi:hypothetical protein [Altererythrobacter sp.]|uniref:hypothetical protein n=1 Tax=Altererythrobacter sp. TaxID=1872480 RepID=UPI001B139ABA|nr:hypothetical protein [Altererythrobacter sp.]MBO6945876.1 hypothetical protein [Altererythrobacter sp.]